MTLQSKRILITGASSGIGAATALVLAKHRTRLALIARREDRLESMSAACLEAGAESVDLFCGSLLDESFFDSTVTEQCKLADICINNAGLALGKDPIANGRDEDWDQMMALNFRAASRVARLCASSMLERGEGDLLSISSIAAHEAYAGGGIYCASKAALRSYMMSLRKETFGRNVRVMMLSPGMVETEFSEVRFRGDTEAAKKVYQGMSALSATEMAEHIEYMLTRPRHVNIDDLVCLSTDQGSATTRK